MPARVVGCVGALVLSFAPANAVAGVVTGSPSGVVFQAEAGETNHVLFAEGTDTFRIIDTGAPLTTAGECTSVSLNEATCNTGGRVTIGLGDFADFAFVAVAHPLSVDAGAGNDTVNVDARFDDESLVELESRVDGGPGNDALHGGGIVLLLGGDGNDALSTSRGTIVIFVGGAGADAFDDLSDVGFSVVSYKDKTASVTADDDSVADDGELGEGDNIRTGINSIEGGPADDALTSHGASLGGFAGNDVLDGRLVSFFFAGGGSGNDRILGSRGSDYLFGDDGNDTILAGAGGDYPEGGRGRDLLRGGSGDDEAVGNQGADRIFGGPGADMLEGRSANDLLVGGSGRDRAFGGPGNDTLRMRDQRADRVHGGRGADRARVDLRLDRVRLVETLI